MCFIADIICNSPVENGGIVSVEGGREGQNVYAVNDYGRLIIKGKHAYHYCDGTDSMFVIRKSKLISARYGNNENRLSELSAVTRIKRGDVIIVVKNEKLTPAKEKYMCELVYLNDKNRKERCYYKNIRELFGMLGEEYGNLMIVVCVGRV